MMCSSVKGACEQKTKEPALLSHISDQFRLATVENFGIFCIHLRTKSTLFGNPLGPSPMVPNSQMKEFSCLIASLLLVAGHHTSMQAILSCRSNYYSKK